VAIRGYFWSARRKALLRIGLTPAAEVLDLKERFRCRRYRAKERAVVSINQWDRKHEGGSSELVPAVPPPR